MTYKKEYEMRAFTKPWIVLAGVALIALVVAGCESSSQGTIEEDTMNSGVKVESIYSFEGMMSEEVLVRYLARAVTHAGLLETWPDRSTQTFEDDVRMLLNIGAKFVGRTAYAWDTPPDDEQHFAQVEERARYVHELDPEIILQAAIFEAVYPTVNQVPIPAWVFEEFGLEPEERNFNYSDMIYEDGLFVGRWGTGSVPDITREETQLWFFYRAARYIDAGIEAIHMGQVHLMTARDRDYNQYNSWLGIMDRIRNYAAEHARRNLVLLDAHTHGMEKDGKLFFDFHSFPLRIKDSLTAVDEATLDASYMDSIYGKSKGGITPSGWETDSLPYIVEFDNYDSEPTAGEAPTIDEHFIWGYDEVTWLAHLTEEQRNEWITYAYNWVKETDPKGSVQFVTRRILTKPVPMEWNGATLSATMYQANAASREVPLGFNQEATIKEIWSNQN